MAHSSLPKPPPIRQLRPLLPRRNPTPLILLPISRITHIHRDQKPNDDNIAKHKPHNPTHKLKDTLEHPAHQIDHRGQDIFREGEEGLEGREEGVEDAV